MLIIIFILVLGHITYSFINPIIQTEKIRNEIVKIEEEIRKVEEENQQLRNKIKLLKTDNYVERVAREKLGMIKKGETLIIPAQPGEEKELNKEDPLY